MVSGRESRRAIYQPPAPARLHEEVACRTPGVAQEVSTRIPSEDESYGIMLADYHLAIPSHRRPELLKATILWLRSHGCSVKPVVFASDEKDRDDYAPINGCELVVTGAKCLTDKFNAIHRHFPIGSRVVVMEDDVVLVEPRNGCGKNGVTELPDVDSLARKGFSLCGVGGIWGIAPHSNAFFFTGRTTCTLKMVVAHFFGFVSTHDDSLEVSLPTKTDYERTARYFTKYGKTWRLDYAGVKTKSYTQSGGMQDDYTNAVRAEMESHSVKELCRKWPHLFSAKKKNTSPFAEVQCKRFP